MPELPEVETVRAGLQAAIAGARIKKVTLRRGDLRVPFPKGFAETLAGKIIQSVERRAKYLLFTLSGGEVLIAHLGMSGRFSVISKKPKSFSKHDHVIMELNDGRTIIFNDARRFGLMTLAYKKDIERHAYFAALGPEPFGKAFSPEYLKAQLKKRKGPIKPALMDQALVVGVGNIYASEALFLASISPKRKAAEVAGKSALIISSIRRVLKDAIASGGSSLRDFIHVSGEVGYFQHRFNVYGRAGKPCPVCKNAIQKITQAGRSTFFCNHCQK